jgi:hypothetical protein
MKKFNNLIFVILLLSIATVENKFCSHNINKQPLIVLTESGLVQLDITITTTKQPTAILATTKREVIGIS